MIIHNTNTGNIIYDYIINFISIGFITYLINNYELIFKYLNKIYSLLYNKYHVEINLEANTSSIDKGDVKINKLGYSKLFKCVTYYIKKIEPCGIYSKREPDNKDIIHKSYFDFFIPDQHKPFLLCPKKNIYCLMKLYEEKNLNKEKSEIIKKHVLKLFSNDKNTTIIDIENFVDNCLKIYNDYNNSKVLNQQYYFCYIDLPEDQYYPEYSETEFNSNRTLNTIFFEDKDIFIKNLNFFLNNKDWYDKKGIPYHFGILLHGLPGCGKTSLIKSILNHTGRNAVVIPLNRIKTCGEFESIFHRLEINDKNIPNDRRIYIFEDIDCICDIIKERCTSDATSDATNDETDDDTIINIKNNEDKFMSQLKLFSKFACNNTLKKTNKIDDKLNLSCILNIFDGILEMPGRIIIITTNYPQKIDKALLRPGRIDINIELKKASKTILYEIVSSFYDVEINEIINMFNNEIKDYILTPSEIINICQHNRFDINKLVSELKSIKN